MPFWSRPRPVAPAPFDSATQAFDTLWDHFRSRPRPEDVALSILRSGAFAGLPGTESVLAAAAQQAFRPSWMAADFHRTTAENFRAAAEYLFPSVPFPGERDAEALLLWIRMAGETIGRAPESDFRRDRLTRLGRRERGITMRRSQYNRRFRFLCRAEDKVRTLQFEDSLVSAKTGLADGVPELLFRKHLRTACYATYIRSRQAVRSLFTAGRQERAFDRVAEEMLRHLEKDPHTVWAVIAWADPAASTVARLSAEERLALLLAAEDRLQMAGTRLAELWSGLGADPRKMIVAPGMNSSAWNAWAGAWNKARRVWLEVLAAAGALDIVAENLPGKVMRLMAADVAAWHARLGHGDDAQVLIWAELPLPWLVLSGQVRCSTADVRAACARHKVDPVATGWSAPAPSRQAVDFRPTPELLHGVVLPDGALARYLRNQGVFGGPSHAKEGHAPGAAVGAIAELLRRRHHELMEQRIEKNGIPGIDS